VAVGVEHQARRAVRHGIHDARLRAFWRAPSGRITVKRPGLTYDAETMAYSRSVSRSCCG
jgi:hypothetical protein